MAKKKPQNIASIKGSKRARQITAAVIEALSGEVGTTEAAERLGISHSRYYQLEAKAIQGMLEAVEPRAKGPQMTPEREIRVLKAEKKTLEKELRRHQSLLRAAYRTVGLPARPAKKSSSKKGAKAARSCRGRTVLQTLRPKTLAPEGGEDGRAKRFGNTDPGKRGQPQGA